MEAARSGLETAEAALHYLNLAATSSSENSSGGNKIAVEAGYASRLSRRSAGARRMPSGVYTSLVPAALSCHASAAGKRRFR